MSCRLWYFENLGTLRKPPGFSCQLHLAGPSHGEALTVNNTNATPIVEMIIETKYQGRELGALLPANNCLSVRYSPDEHNPIASIIFLNVASADALRLLFMIKRKAAAIERDKSIRRKPNFVTTTADARFESQPARINCRVM